MKFGGTSVGSAEAIAQSAEIVRAAQKEWPALAVIVSAMSGVTDMLLKGANTAANGDSETFRRLARELRAKHENAIIGLLNSSAAQQAVRDHVFSYLDEFENLCHAVNTLGEVSPRAADAISSLGERMSIHLLTARLQQMGLAAEALEASEFILTDELFGAANPMMEKTAAHAEKRLREKMNNGEVPVITGFIGATKSGAVTTLGRGGSDYSAGILGAALNANAVWIWTDVNGVMTADPRIIAEAQTLPELSFREISELAYYGAKVVHPKTIRPVIERGIELWIKNTFNPDHPGTRIVSDNHRISGKIKAVTAIKGQSMMNIEGRGMLGVPGVAARTFSAVAHAGASVTLITQASSEQSICFSVPSALAARVRSALEEEFRLELHRRDIDNIAVLDQVVIVTVVGAGMKHTPGIAGKIFSALGNQNVNVIAIAQGSSECSISLIVDANAADAAVRAIHGLIGTNKT
ncbi:MAG: Bifunctional aspartokinase/homoserine dehydrogenase 1 [bacterium]|nr:Bifunctional aspartokinase/homoserine dehydrogenase 1 [bacterium]